MNRTNAPSSESSLAKNTSRFAFAASGIAAFYLAPLIAKNLRGDMYQYLFTDFGYEVAQWGSWAFVAVVILASFFGVSMLLQLLIQGVIRGTSRKRVI